MSKLTHRASLATARGTDLRAQRECLKHNIQELFSMKIYYDNDADPKALAGKRIAVIGYGSQGFGHSNNLKDSGCDVIVWLRSDSPSVAKAQSAGFVILPPAHPPPPRAILLILTP